MSSRHASIAFVIYPEITEYALRALVKSRRCSSRIYCDTCIDLSFSNVNACNSRRAGVR